MKICEIMKKKIKGKGMTEHNFFKPEETACKCGCGMNITDDFLAKLNALRADVGMPFYINSGARCEEHNKRIGGSERSAHKLGRAVDIRITSPEFRTKLEAKRIKHGLRRGWYNTFFHIDDMEDRNDFDMRGDK